MWGLCFYSKPTIDVKNLFIQLIFGISLFFSGFWVLFVLGFGGVISAQENNLASNCHVVFDKTTVCNICLLLLRVL